MIFVKDGVVNIQGSSQEIAVDLMGAIIGTKSVFEKHMGEEKTREIIAEVARKAYDPPEGLTQTLIDVSEIRGGAR